MSRALDINLRLVSFNQTLGCLRKTPLVGVLRRQPSVWLNETNPRKFKKKITTTDYENWLKNTNVAADKKTIKGSSVFSGRPFYYSIVSFSIL
uniref:Uncharacterized protein n=1 Tax=Magallana gigas TaxID=29159 RepID=K1RB77_MAGGI